MPTVGTYYLDQALTALINGATDVNINTAEPSTYTAATSGATFLGKKVWGAGAVFNTALGTSGLQAGTSSGRKITSKAITDGAISTGGSAAAASVTDNTNSRLGVTTTLSASQTVTAGNPFTLTAFDVNLAGA